MSDLLRSARGRRRPVMTTTRRALRRGRVAGAEKVPMNPSRHRRRQSAASPRGRAGCAMRPPGTIRL